MKNKLRYDALKRVHFLGFHKYPDVGKMLAYEAQVYKDGNYKDFFKLYFNAPYVGCNYHTEGRGGDCMFLLTQSSQSRPDHMNAFENVIDSLEQTHTYIYPVKVGLHPDFSIKEKLLIFIWTIQMIKIFRPFSERNFLANLLASAKRRFDYLKGKIETYNPKILTVWNDAELTEYLIVEYCRKKKITTVTLQHGAYNSMNAMGNFIYSNSHSDYFVTYNRFMKQEIDCLRRKKINTNIPLGNPRYINQKWISERDSSKIENKFLILLDGVIESNIQLIEIGDAYATMTGIHYDVKPHPFTTIEPYREIISKYGTIIQNVIDEDFFYPYLFAVVCETSAKYDAVYNLVPTVIFDNGHISKINFGLNSFTNIQEFDKAVKKALECPEKIKELRDYAIGSGNIGQNYRNFYRTLLE